MTNLIKMLQEDSTVLIHGTSIEATLHLLKTGMFDYGINGRKKIHQDSLFFSPNIRYFTGIGLDSKECTWYVSLGRAISYAKFIADMHFIERIAGFIPENIGELNDRDDIEVESLLLPEFKKHDYSRDYLRDLLKATKKRHGVIIGFNEKILEQKIEPGKDDPEREVSIYLPKGISIDYISGIQPLGKVELEILRHSKIVLPQSI